MIFKPVSLDIFIAAKIYPNLDEAKVGSNVSDACNYITVLT